MAAGKAPASTLIWLRAERAARGPRPTLHRDEITKAAIRLADTEGLEAVSMRRIAAKLGSGATSLYWHVQSKDDLHELMVDEVFGEIALPELTDDWRADLRMLALASHTTFQRHPWIVLLGIQPGLGPKTRRYGDATLPIFDPLRLDLSVRVNILAAVNNYLFGFAHREVAWRQLRERSGLTDQQWAERLANYVDDASQSDRELAEHMVERFTLASQTSFEFGLECLLDGIQARVTA